MKSIVIVNTRYHKIMQVFTLILLIAVYLFLAVYWKQIPDRIPAHFNGQGEIDRWGGKSEILICPAMLFFLYLGMRWVQRKPQLWNTGITVTPANSIYVHRYLKDFLVTINFVVVLIFGVITVYQALGIALPGLFLPLLVVAMTAPIVYVLIQLYRVRNI